MAITVKNNRLSPLLKYPGGKEKELKYILPNLPNQTGRYYEPFVGGGAVYFALDCDHYYINDRSAELIHLYQMVGDQNPEFMGKIRDIEHNWDVAGGIVYHHMEELTDLYGQYKDGRIDKDGLSDSTALFVNQNRQEFNGILDNDFNIETDHFLNELTKSVKNKMTRMSNLENKKGPLPDGDIVLNLEGAFKNAFYMHFRYLYNHVEKLEIGVPFATAIYFFIREYCYSSMFRYNREGKFNVPYGGISYNKKSLAKKVEYFTDANLVDQLGNTTIANLDFMDFVTQYVPAADDFMFLDPPYDTEFSTYAQNEFTQNDQARLADYLIHHCPANFMLIIKNTDYILNLYPDGMQTAGGRRLYVNRFDKKYFVSFQDRNDKHAEHLMITNYMIPEQM